MVVNEWKENRMAARGRINMLEKGPAFLMTKIPQNHLGSHIRTLNELLVVELQDVPKVLRGGTPRYQRDEMTSILMIN